MTISNDFRKCVISTQLSAETNSLLSLFLSQFVATSDYSGSSEVKREDLQVNIDFVILYYLYHFIIITIANTY